MAKVLGIFAHPDDETISCGGTLAKHAANGDQVFVFALSDGVASRFRPHTVDEYRAAKARRLEHYQMACAILKIQPFLRLVFKDQQSDQIPQLTINREVERIIGEYKPDLLYSHFDFDRNFEHRRVADAAVVAARGICPVYQCQPEWPSLSLMPFEPNHREWIFSTINQKTQALIAYADELREYPHPRSLKIIQRQKREAFKVYEG